MISNKHINRSKFVHKELAKIDKAIKVRGFMSTDLLQKRNRLINYSCK